MPFNAALLAERNIDPAGNPAKYDALLSNLQGNILKGHGRERSAHIFLRFQGNRLGIAGGLQGLAATVTTMKKQLADTQQFKDFGVPGALFVTLALSASGYHKLQLPLPSDDPSFVQGMVAAGPSFGDSAQTAKGFADGGVDAVLMLAADEEEFLLREVRARVDTIAAGPWATVATVQIGRALRNEAGQGIEHFGFVDGRSQPLYLLSDLCDEINPRTGAAIDSYDPSEPLSRVLIPDLLAPTGAQPQIPAATDACGSLMVFRKLEQNVQGFRIKEQELATALGLVGPDRARAGAMVVGRFQDGTPLVNPPVNPPVPSPYHPPG